MMRTANWKRLVAAAVCAGGLALGVLSAGCDDGYVEAGDMYTPSVEPADFSPYGYDYTMYDIFTSDLE